MRYSYNTNAFDRIQNEQDAYWLGFILADGYVSDSDKKPLLQIKLAHKDKRHLEKFAKYLGYNSNHIIKDCSGGAYTQDNLCHVIKISNKNIVQNLSQYGLSGAKSGKEIPIILGDNNLTAAYVRGIFDGDGYISTYDDRIGIVGSFETCLYVKNFFEKTLIEKIPNNILKHGTIYRFNITSKKLANRALDILYQHADIYLDRKYQLYLKRKNCVPC